MTFIKNILGTVTFNKTLISDLSKNKKTSIDLFILESIFALSIILANIHTLVNNTFEKTFSTQQESINAFITFYSIITLIFVLVFAFSYIFTEIIYFLLKRFEKELLFVECFRIICYSQIFFIIALCSTFIINLVPIDLSLKFFLNFVFFAFLLVCGIGFEIFGINTITSIDIFSAIMIIFSTSEC